MKKIYIFLFFLSTFIVASPQVIKKVEVKQGDLVITFDRAYDKKAIKYFPLSNPPRKVFDIPHTILPKGVKRHFSYNSKIRVAQYNKDIVRVVIETIKPYKCMTYRPKSRKNLYCIPLPKSTSNNKNGYTQSSVKKKKKTQTKKPYKNLDNTYIVPTPNSKKDVIVIDPGHGGYDSGAVSGRKMEKRLVLQISKRVERYLKKMGYRVYLTRKDDRFLKLSQRTRVADKKDAKVFVSIHANSVPKKLRNKVYGVETYYLNTSKDHRSSMIAARENAAVLKGAKTKLSKKVIIESVLNGPKAIESTKLAIDVQRNIVYYLQQHYNNIKDGGVRSDTFYVLVGASRPSILVEVGYLSHPTERKRLFSSSYQDKIAKGIAKGIDSYLRNRKKDLDL